MPSVLVVGAGAFGLASAWRLSERGVTDVTVIDSDYPASGSSGRSVGMVQTQHLTPLNIEGRAVAMRLLNMLADEHGLEIRRSGYVRLGYSEEHVDAFARSVDLQHSLGITHPRLLTQTQLRDLVPDLRVDDVAGALFGPEDGYLDGHMYCGLLVELLKERGVTVRPRTKLLAAERVSGGRHRLATSQGDFVADVVINASGAWAESVAALLGTTAQIRSERHQAVVAHLERPLSYIMPCLQAYFPGSGRAGLYVRQERADQLVIGLHSLDPIGEIVDPASYLESNDLVFLSEVAGKFTDRFPGFEDAQMGKGWAGIYPMSRDGLPVVGPAPEDQTVLHAIGGGGAGIMWSQAVGELVADWVLDGKPTCIPDSDALSAARFQTELE
jgi:sarcosine oxidase subunit beta